MQTIVEFIKLIKAPFSADNYYQALNHSLRKINNEFTMLHYPFFINADDSFLRAQKNLTDYCISMLGPVKGKRILEIGCGNGIQLLYILRTYEPSFAAGVDLNYSNISIALEEKRRENLQNIHFEVNNSQDISGIEDESFDFVVCIESAFHYPDKQSFLSEVRRVLKSDGKFLIADLTFSKNKFTLVSKYFRRKLGLFHWTHERYMEGFKLSNLEIIESSNITGKVIKGFLRYPYWIDDMKRRKSVNRLNRFFCKFILKLFIYLLRNRRNYEVFLGQKI